MGIVIEQSIKEKLQSTYLWRYMSLPKFLDLITTQTLYFATNTQLIIGDPYEGTLPLFTDFLFNLDNERSSILTMLPDEAQELINIFDKVDTKGISSKIN